MFGVCPALYESKFELIFEKNAIKCIKFTTVTSGKKMFGWLSWTPSSSKMKMHLFAKEIYVNPNIS